MNDSHDNIQSGRQVSVSVWRKMLETWAKYTPPGRPSQQDVENFRLRLEAHLETITPSSTAPARILILGATPEIRSMLAAYDNVQVTLIDHTWEMIQVMTELVTVPDPHETWVRGDWIDAPLAEGYFDAVLSDLVLSNLPPEKQLALMDRVASLLKPDGRWITRADCVDEYSRFVELEELLEKYAAIEEPTQQDVCFLRCAAGLRFWDEETGRHRWEALGEAMSRYRQGERFVHENPKVVRLLEGVYDITAPFDKPYWLKRKHELESDFEKRFQLHHTIADETTRPHGERGYYLYDLQPR